MIHELKTWPVYFGAVAAGKKTFEIRKDDRGFGIGDWLHLCEWDPQSGHYTGRYVNAEVTYILRADESAIAAAAVAPGFCVLGLSLR